MREDSARPGVSGNPNPRSWILNLYHESFSHFAGGFASDQPVSFGTFQACVGLLSEGLNLIFPPEASEAIV